MNIWKLGCNWGSNAPSFYNFIKEQQIVISHDGKVFPKDSIILIAEGHTVKAIAMLLETMKPITLLTNLKSSINQLEIGFKDSNKFGKAAWFELPIEQQFKYELQQGICQVRNVVIKNKAIKLKELYFDNGISVNNLEAIPSNTFSNQIFIDQYKKEFDRINDLEIYKWKAVKCFQDNWNVDAANFADMLEAAFDKTKSLLDSGNYFPLRMLIKNARTTPIAVQELFAFLYEEEIDLNDRVEGFIKRFNQLNENNFPGKKDYQDHRAVVVYLCMRYPEDYFLYKFTMFTQFAKLIDYHYTPKRGKTENIFQYLHLCEQLKSQVAKDETLQRLHKQRIVNNPTAYAGDSTNLLVQDIIYSATFHFKEVAQEVRPINPTITITIEDTPTEIIINKNTKTKFKGTITNHATKQKRNKRVGNAGELFIVQQENKRLLPLKKQVEHVAVTQGDGLGYDIKSYDEDGQEIYIEVKTTTQGFSTPFFITRTELARSRVEGDRFRLYRVYDFDIATGVGNIHITKGALDRYCLQPESYRVGLRRVKTKRGNKQ